MNLDELFTPPPGIRAEFLEWHLDLMPGVNVELMEVLPGSVSLSDIYLKPGTVLELEEVELLEYKVAL